MPMDPKIRLFGKFLLLLALSSALPAAAQLSEDEIPPRGGTGQISVITEPSRAMVYLGGRKLGLTPVDTTYPSGRYTLTIMYNGEELLTERVNIWPDRKTEIERTLVMPYGSVTLTTKPAAKVQVSIDGEVVGATEGGPLTINNIEAGPRLFTLSRGRRTKDLEVNVLPEQNVEIHVDLTRR